MGKAIKNAVLFGLLGLLFGAVAGVILGSAWTTNFNGQSLQTLDYLAMFEDAPWARGSAPWYEFEWLSGPLTEPFRTSSIIVGAAMLIGMIGAIVLTFDRRLTSHGSARWSTPAELKKAGLLATGKQLVNPVIAKLGKPKSSAPFVSSDTNKNAPPHAFVSAPTGSGKGVGVVIPTLLTYAGSIVCLDVKGENYAKTARRRETMGDRVFKFAPFDDRYRTHRFNPVAEIAKQDARWHQTQAQRLAASFITLRGESAQGFLKGAQDTFAAGVMLAIERGTPSISAVHDMLSGEGDTAAMFDELADEVNHPESKAQFRRMAGMDSRPLSSYMSVLFDGGLSGWSNGFVRDATDASDFSLDGLRKEPTSIYIIVSPNDLDLLAPLIRLMFQQTIGFLQKAEPVVGEEPYPVLLMLDEFPSLGRMDVLRGAITTLRSYAGRMVIISQSIADVRSTYGKDETDSLLSNCGLQLFMAPGDAETPEYVSKAVGDFTRKSRSKSWSTGEMMKSNVQERSEGARLVRPEEVRALGTEDCIVLVQNMSPVRAKKVFYYQDRYLKRLFEKQKGDLPEPDVLVAPTKGPPAPLPPLNLPSRPTVPTVAAPPTNTAQTPSIPATTPAPSPATASPEQTSDPAPVAPGVSEQGGDHREPPTVLWQSRVEELAQRSIGRVREPERTASGATNGSLPPLMEQIETREIVEPAAEPKGFVRPPFGRDQFVETSEEVERVRSEQMAIIAQMRQGQPAN